MPRQPTAISTSRTDELLTVEFERRLQCSKMRPMTQSNTVYHALVCSCWCVSHSSYYLYYPQRILKSRYAALVSIMSRSTIMSSSEDSIEEIRDETGHWGWSPLGIKLRQYLKRQIHPPRRNQQCRQQLHGRRNCQRQYLLCGVL